MKKQKQEFDIKEGKDHNEEDTENNGGNNEAGVKLIKAMEMQMNLEV